MGILKFIAWKTAGRKDFFENNKWAYPFIRDLKVQICFGITYLHSTTYDMLLHSCLTYIFHSHVRTACQIVYAAISFAFYFALTFSIHKLELFDTFSKPLFYAKPRRINFSFFTGYTIKRWSFDFSHKILSRFRAVSFLLLFNGRNRNFSFFTGYIYN